MRKFTQRIYFVLAFLLLGHRQEVLKALEKERIQIPGTRISIIPPDGYKYLNSVNTLRNKDLDATLIFTEASKYRQELSERHSLLFQLNGFSIISNETIVTIGNLKGTRTIFQKKISLMNEEYVTSRLYLFGDSSATLIIMTIFPDSLSRNFQEEMDSSIATIEWNKSRRLTPMELFDFSLEEGGDFKMNYADGRHLVLTPFGQQLDTLNQLPFVSLVMMGKPDKIAPDISLQNYMEMLLQNIPWSFEVSRVLVKTELILDGVKAYETVSAGKRTIDDSSIVIYRALIFHPEADIAILGVTSTENTEATIDTFKTIAHSFRIKRKVPADNSECRNLLNSGKYDRAIKCFEAELKKNPDNYTASIGKADALRLAGRHKEAISEYSKTIAQNKTNGEAYRGRAKSYTATRKYEEAVIDVYHASELNSYDVECIIECGTVRESYGDYLKAAYEYRRAIDIAPDSLRYYILWGNSYAKRGDKTEAANIYSKAIAKDSAYFDAYAVRGQIYHEKGNYALALDDYNHALKLNPGADSLYAARGLIRFASGNYQEAVNNFSKCIKKNDREKQYILLRGQAYTYMGKLAEATKDFNHVLKIDNKESNALLYRGIFSYMDGKFTEALADFQKAVKSDWRFMPRFWLYIANAKIYSVDGAKRKALGFYNAYGKKGSGKDAIGFQYMMGDLTEDEFLERINIEARNQIELKPELLRDTRCFAYFVIAVKNYSVGLKTIAKKYLKKAAETNATGIFEYEFSKLFLSGRWDL